MINTLILKTDNLTSGYIPELIDTLSLFCIIFGIYVIGSKNPILSVLFLIGLFLSISLYLMLLNMIFIGLSYLLVYVGAVSILFIFILMLINVRISELLNETSNSLTLGILASILISIPAYLIINQEKSIFSLACAKQGLRCLAVRSTKRHTIKDYSEYLINIFNKKEFEWSDFTENYEFSPKNSEIVSKDSEKLSKLNKFNHDSHYDSGYVAGTNNSNTSPVSSDKILEQFRGLFDECSFIQSIVVTDRYSGKAFKLNKFNEEIEIEEIYNPLEINIIHLFGNRLDLSVLACAKQASLNSEIPYKHDVQVKNDMSLPSIYTKYTGDLMESNVLSEISLITENLNKENKLVNDNMLLVSSNIWDSNLMESSHITSIGNILYTSHAIWLIITSIILLLAMVGAIVITKKEKD